VAKSESHVDHLIVPMTVFLADVQVVVDIDEMSLSAISQNIASGFL